MPSGFVFAWLRAFVFTQVVEAPIYRYGYGASWGVSLGASAITHPIVWFVFFGPIGLSFDASYEARVVAAELFAWLVEAAFVTYATKKPNGVGWALVANGASVALGQLARRFTHGRFP